VTIEENRGSITYVIVAIEVVQVSVFPLLVDAVKGILVHRNFGSVEHRGLIRRGNEQRLVRPSVDRGSR
jgi:hypothetical protein